MLSTFSRISLEKNQITDDYMLLQKAYTSLQELKERLENKESEIQHNLTDAHKEADQNKIKLKQAQKHIDDLEKKCDKYELSISELNNNLNSLHSEYDFLSLRTKVVSIELSIKSYLCPKCQKSKLIFKVSYVSMVPLSMLIMAILIAFYPTLATITATTI